MMDFTRSTARVKVSADGGGVVSHAGAALLRETAEYTGLVGGVSAALADTYRGPWLHAPGRVFCDVAVAVADGARCVSGIEVLGDREGLFGAVASMPTAWRCLERVDDVHLPGVQAARAVARQRAWAAGAGPELDAGLVLDVDATISVAHSEKENAAATWKRSFGFHPLLVFLDRPEISGGEALAGLLRAGNAGSNTAADHIAVLDQALAALPAHARPDPDDANSVRVLVRSDSAGATHAFAEHCRTRGVQFSLGFPVDWRIQALVDDIPDELWAPAIEDDGIRDGAWVAEASWGIDLSAWPAGSRLILRKERPHPGAQLSFTDADGMRITTFITDTGPRVVPHQEQGLELRHRQHARVEDRIREGKDTGLARFPCFGWAENNAWLQVALTALDLTAWTQLIAFDHAPALAHCEINTFRYRVLHVAARITRGGRQTKLGLDKHWRWAAQIAEGFHRLRAAFA